MGGKNKFKIRPYDTVNAVMALSTFLFHYQIILVAAVFSTAGCPATARRKFKPITGHVTATLDNRVYLVVLVADRLNLDIAVILNTFKGAPLKLFCSWNYLDVINTNVPYQ